MQDVKPPTKAGMCVIYAGLAAICLCLGLVALSAIMRKTSSNSVNTLLETGSQVCEQVFAPVMEAEPTTQIGAPRPTRTPTPTRLALVVPALTLVNVTYGDNGWEIANRLDEEADFVQEVNSLVCIRQNRSSVGRYTNGGEGYRVRWEVRLATWPDGDLIDEETFYGGDPPSTKQGGGDRYGSLPSKHEVDAWLRSHSG